MKTSESGLCNIYTEYEVERMIDSTDYLLDIETGYSVQLNGALESISPDGKYVVTQVIDPDDEDEMISELYEVIIGDEVIELEKKYTLPKVKDMISSVFWMARIGSPDFMCVFDGTRLFVMDIAIGNLDSITYDIPISVNQMSDDEPFDGGLLLVKKGKEDKPRFVRFVDLIDYIDNVLGR
jgi:hypothetical protein